MQILVHTCCGPCGTYVFQKLIEDGHQVVGYYYNPNIYPPKEYKKRKEVAAEFLMAEGIEFIEEEYNPEEYYQAIGENKKAPQRCEKCFNLRLSQTARKAKEMGFDGFTTTLLISPYQDQELLNRIGQEIEENTGIKYYSEDFRTGYRKSRGMAGQRKMYQQKYCGCEFSLSESVAT